MTYITMLKHEQFSDMIKTKLKNGKIDTRFTPFKPVQFMRYKYVIITTSLRKIWKWLPFRGKICSHVIIEYSYCLYSHSNSHFYMVTKVLKHNICQRNILLHLLSIQPCIFHNKILCTRKLNKVLNCLMSELKYVYFRLLRKNRTKDLKYCP